MWFVVYTLLMTWTQRASYDDIVTEMRRKPDPEILLEWVFWRTKDDANTEVARAIKAYWDGLEYEHS